MTPESFLNGFAQAVVDQSFDRAEKMLAPWIRSQLPVGGLKRVVRLARGDNPPAVEFELAELEETDAASMREDIDDVPDEITDENFRGCWQIEFQPDEDADADVEYSYAFYLALVADGKELMIGYLEPVD
ncbi:MAG: hypothetical protein ABI664_14120 [bacterium]